MDILKLIVLSLIFSGCAKTIYIAEQTKGQLSLQWNGVENKELLQDPAISIEVKNKIRLIEEYKKYFYNYWKVELGGIYTKTTMLENEAVTWLVITSHWNEVKALKECFPFTGCFPYLGFFNKESATNWMKDKKEEGLQAWMRPVYAYSTLGYFEDRILSSFFEYDQYELAELVFHELFHVLYFLKDNVEFNENLANFYGEEMAKEYFENRNDSGYLEWKNRLKASSIIRRQVSDHAKELHQLYETQKPKDQNEAQKILKEFVDQTFRPKIDQECKKLGLKKCSVSKGEWNNARFAATLTYEKAAPNFYELFKTHGDNLVAMLDFIKQREKDFDSSGEKDFTAFLFSDKMNEKK